MRAFTKIFFTIAVVAAISACGGNDQDNSDIVSTLEEQNQLLREANELERAQPSVTFTGHIIDLSSESSVDASVRVKVGSTWSEPVSTENGYFEVPNILPLSDYILEVSSPTGDFLTRAFWGRSYSSDGIAIENLGDLGVSPGVIRSYSLLNSANDEPAEGFELKAYSHVANQFINDPAASEVEAYAHIATYNSASGTYDITVPESIPISIRGSLDIDNDEINDYLPSNGQFLSGNSIYLSSQYVPTTSVIYVNETHFGEPVNLKIAVRDAQFNALPDLTLSVSDELNGNIFASYDSAIERYSLTVKVSSRLSVNVPSFSVGGVSYDESTIYLYRRNDSYFEVVYDNSDTQSVRFNLSENDLELSFVPDRKAVPSVRILSQTEKIGNDGVYSILFSAPISVNSNNIGLSRPGDVNVVRGNDSNSDLIPEGFTLVDKVITQIPVMYTLTDGDTRFNIEPIGGLEEGVRYEYLLQGISEKESNAPLRLSLANASFITEVTGTFDINSIIADNANYTTGGELITAANTAGDVSIITTSFRSTRIFFPIEVRNLNRFVLTLRLINRNGVLNVQDRKYIIVRDRGDFLGENYALTVANNEDITADYSVILGTTLDEGFWLEEGISLSGLQDHTDATPNTLSFEYELERPDGAVETGTIELEIQ